MLLLALSCGEPPTDPSVPPPPPPPPQPATLSVTPEETSLTALGATVQLAAAVRDQYDRVMAGAEVAWSSRDASVATVDESGRVTAAGNGEATITARSGAVSGSASVTVRQEPAAATLAPDSLLLAALGDTARLEATVTDANGHPIDDARVVWASADASVATVDESGLVTAVSAGRATVTAAAGEARADVAIIVELRAVSITIGPPVLEFAALGDTARLNATVTDANGHPIDDARVVWASADASVATVDESGLVSAAGNGSAMVKATSGSASGEVAVTVAQIATRMTISPPRLFLIADGDTASLVVAVLDANGREVAGAMVAWSTADSSIAVVDRTGLVSAAGAGNTEVTAAHDSLTASAAVEVAAPPSGDREVLELLYRAWNGDDWHDRTNWLTDAPLSEWAGVRTDASGRVEYLLLGGNNAEGRIPAAIGLLDQLYVLNLAGNSLRGPIPPQVADLRRLNDLILSDNDISGPLPPEMGNMAALRYLDVQNTNLVGPLPDAFARLAMDTFYLGGSFLCVPTALHEWFARFGYDPPACIPVTSDRDALVALYRATGGRNWDRRRGWLTDGPINQWEGIEADEEGYVTILYMPRNNLAGPLPPELGNLARLEQLILYGNDLTGGIPPELGRLTNLRQLSMSENRLEGSIPSELGNLVNVDTLYLSNNRLSGPLPPELGNMAALERLALFDNRLSGPLPPEIGNLRNLTDLELNDNVIEGPLPPELGNMVSLEVISLTRNQVSGPLPAELGRLGSLRSIELQHNRIEGAIPPSLGNLAALEALTLSINRLTGPIPRELGNLSNLTFLSLFENELSGAIPPELGNLGKLETLWLGHNELTGTIPGELGTLSALTDLGLGRNRLSGPIPPELASLRSLTFLALFTNNLSGPVPPELGNLRGLENLWLSRNPLLQGLLPRSLMNIESLSSLSAFETGLCAQIDDEFQGWLGTLDASLEDCETGRVERLALAEFFAASGGDSWTRSDGWDTAAPVADWYGLTSRGGRVRSIALADNGLAGPVPPEIANLTALEMLDLGGNALAGAFPSAIASIEDLASVRVSGNRDMAGPLPFRLTELTRLEVLQYEDTGLCASPAKTFQAWLGRIDVVAGAVCGNLAEVRLSLPVVYLTQAIQRPAGDVPLIAGRDALLRVFLASDESGAFFEPEVVATLTHGGREAHRVVMRRDGDLLVTAADESDLRNSYNAVIPGEHIRSGVELTVEADPGGTVPLAAGSEVRFPASGAAALNVIEVPPMEVTVVPVLEAAEPDSSIFAWTDGIGDDSPEVGLFRYAFPFGEFRARSRETYITSLDLTSDDGQWGLVLEMEALRALDNGTGYYYAAAASVNGYVRGRARLAAWASIGKAWDTELAHEVGHNLDLLHAPCGGALGTDPNFPHPNGGIGAWGYDFRDGSLVSAERRRDIMGYCYERGWLSDYYFEKVIEYRERVEGDRARALIASERSNAEMLVLWGGVVGGVPRLEPTFRATMAARLPDAAGPYVIEAAGDGGDIEFSLAFTPGEDKFGDKYFFFAIPVEADWADSLDRITLIGPEGVVSLGADEDRAVTVVTDPATGSVRALLRDWDGPLPAALGSARALDVSTSRGIRDAVRPRP